MKVEIEVSSAIDGQFADVQLCYSLNGQDKKVKLRLPDFERLHDFTQDSASLALDFLLISSITYGIDDLFARKKWSYNGWTREFEVEFPVLHLRSWQSHSKSLEEILGFLTGDLWSISFRELGNQNLYKPKDNRRSSTITEYNYEDYEFVSLFSGGLDSLIGVIDKLEVLPDGRKGLLISHFDSTYSGPKSDQDRIIEKLDSHFSDMFTHLRGRVLIANKYADGMKVQRDTNQRSRSFLFIGLGVYLLQKVPNVNVLQIPENGTISLNHPLTPSRSSSLSTRTTHPHFIKSLEAFLQRVGLNVEINNDYGLSTKGQMVENCSNAPVLLASYSESASCAKRGHKRYWSNRHARQCGVCMPCIYRRAALHCQNLDNETYGDNLMEITDPRQTKKDMRALFDFLISPLSLKEIKRNLLVSGRFDSETLDDYAEVIVNARAELKKWIGEKGTIQLRQYLGVQ